VCIFPCVCMYSNYLNLLKKYIILKRKNIQNDIIFIFFSPNNVTSTKHNKTRSDISQPQQQTKNLKWHMQILKNSKCFFKTNTIIHKMNNHLSKLKISDEDAFFYSLNLNNQHSYILRWFKVETILVQFQLRIYQHRFFDLARMYLDFLKISVVS